MTLTEFVLVTLMYSRGLWTPVSAEIFPNKAACELVIKDRQQQHCVPRIKTVEQK